jgi:hypothetical protein
MTERGRVLAEPLPIPGEYAVADLAPCTLQVRIRRPGYTELLRELLLHEQPAEQVHELVLRPCQRFRVRFLDERGQPFEAQLPEFEREQVHLGAIATLVPPARLPFLDFLPARFDLGRYHLLGHGAPRAPERILEVLAEPPYYVSATWGRCVLATVPVSAAPEELELRIPDAALLGLFATASVRALDAQSGAPVPEARLTIHVIGMKHEARADPADGGCRIERLWPGLGRFVVAAPGYAPRRFCRPIERGAAVELGELGLHPPSLVEVRLEDANGVLVPGRLECLDLEGAGVAGRWITHQVGDTWSTGGVTQVPLGRSRYLLVATDLAHPRIARAEVDTRTALTEPVRLVLQPMISLVIAPTLAEGDTPFLRVIDESGLPVYEYCPASSTLDDGGTELHVPSGNYRVELWDDEVRAKSIPFRVETRPAVVVVAR